MNERIRQLAEQANANELSYAYYRGEKKPENAVTLHSVDLEKFAELIVAECKENFSKVWYEQGMDIRGAEIGKFLTRFDEHFGVGE